MFHIEVKDQNTKSVVLLLPYFNNLRIRSLEAVGSTDNDDRVTVDNGGSTTVESVVTVQDPTGPGELILSGVLTSHYSGVGDSTFLGK